MKNLPNKNNNNNGFTLLEVLISVVLLSFGLLGAAGMQIKSQQFNRTAYFETQAIIVAHDMLERIRSNVAGQREGHYHLPHPTKHITCYTLAGCSILEMAQNDMFEWTGDDTDSIGTKLPGGSGIVCLDTTPDDGSPGSPNCDNSGDTYAIKIWWLNPDDEVRRAVITAAFQ